MCNGLYSDWFLSAKLSSPPECCDRSCLGRNDSSAEACGDVLGGGMHGPAGESAFIVPSGRGVSISCLDEFSFLLSLFQRPGMTSCLGLEHGIG